MLNIQRDLSIQSSINSQLHINEPIISPSTQLESHSPVSKDMNSSIINRIY